MTYSMTAFTRKTLESEWGSLSWELRSVNHRYLEIFVRMPETLRDLEKIVRSQIQQKLIRGKIEAILSFNPGKKLPFDFVINDELMMKLSEISQKVTASFTQSHINVFDVLKWDGILQIKETRMEQVVESAVELLKSALEDMVEMRQREGLLLKSFIEERLRMMDLQIQLIQQSFPKILEMQRKKIISRFEELNLSIDKDRLEHEMVWLIQKTDIAEELLRLKAHLIEVQRTLNNGISMGRRLDFLMQELNREANTIASKSLDASVTQAAVEMKVLVEQMREQVQNIE